MKLAPALLGSVMAVAAAAPSIAQTPPGPVVVVVKVPRPWYAPQALVVSKMRDTVPQYEKLPGLAYKMFSLSPADSTFGGLYFWRSRADAQAWFNPAWFERVEKERGAKGDVRTFDAPLTVDNTANGALASSDSKAVATVVLIPTPTGVTRQRLEAEFRAAVPVYQKVPGLLRKHFVVTDDGQFGGVYLWADKAAAHQWFSPAWHARVQQTYGQDARLEWYDTPILLPTAVADNRVDVVRP